MELIRFRLARNKFRRLSSRPFPFRLLPLFEPVINSSCDQKTVAHTATAAAAHSLAVLISMLPLPNQTPRPCAPYLHGGAAAAPVSSFSLSSLLFQHALYIYLYVG